MISGWPTAAATNTETPPVAMDTGNPWSNTESVSEEQAGWADFSNAGFADFDANFGSGDVQATDDHGNKNGGMECNFSNSPPTFSKKL